MEDGDKIEQRPAPQRIMNEMRARPSPKNDVGTPEIRGNLFPSQHRSISDVAGYDRVSVTDDTSADRRPEPVTADERSSFDLFARLQLHRNAVGAIGEAGDPSVRL